MIVCENVSFSYGKGKETLINLNLELNPGLILIVGPNGCGKSTLLRLIAGVEMADAGKILINGIDLWRNEVSARSQLVYLPEYPDLTPYATIKEIMDLVCRLRGQPIKKGTEALLDCGLQHLMKRTVRELSNGQRRRAIFATCLVGEAPVILLDEPLEGMDLQMQKKILSWLGKRKDDESTILLASHTLQPFLPLVNQAVTITNGQAEHLADLPGDKQQKQLFLEKLAEG